MSDHPVSTAAPRVTVALVFGGVSTEHGVSCLTAGNVVRALDAGRYEVVGIGITRDGRWLRLTPEQVAGLQTRDGRLPSVPEEGTDALLYRDGDTVLLAGRDGTTLVDPVPVDVAFALLHGSYGEDGTIQGQFEMLGLPYVGSGVAASANAMDKERMKQVLSAGALPVGPYTAFTRQQWDADPAACLDAVATLRFPVYVKPCSGGSSIGITRVTDPDAVTAAVEEAFRHDTKCMVEQGVADVREVECGVLEGPDGLRTSVPGEIVMHTEGKFYDFDAKYLPEEQVTLAVPADLDEEVVARVQEVAVRTFEAVGAAGLARVDTFVTTDGRVLVNEINTMPGFTEHSMYPQVWAASGVDYPMLVDQLLQQALRRRPTWR
ncbi:D-alanine--D-alanine ligase [Desertihabitans brevis]|uniref:D-alanine--D-alanine ligase n=1 Tax=Desertihabitans brevis TaxID=2268447 RepID=A0A367YZZ7_9ACTN|nr:D-alanine--D-alanine ligase family protein [Desertihabitans brevis]RCK71408.1 D-alanine--D-alanine ligase [Desertihabitans brevis]